MYALYESVRGRYRGHAAGTRFVARLDRRVEERAIRRGDIRLIERMTPALVPGSFSFPQGWLSTDGGGR